MHDLESKNAARPKAKRRRKTKWAEDRHLPQLARALDAAWMKPALQEFFRREYPDRGLQVERVNIGKVYHKPGKDCRITYDVHCRDRENKIYSMWFQTKMSANGKDRAGDREGMPRAWPGCGFWKPVSVWPEMDMVLFTFPYDRKLPHLGYLLETEWVKRQVDANLAGFGFAGNAECREVTCKKVKYMPGKRCVLRYEIAVAEAARELQRKVFFSKTYDDAQSRYVHQILQRVCASAACRDGRLSVPAPIAHLDAVNTIWQHAWDGENFDAVMQRLGWNNFPQTDFPEKIAVMLAALHQIVIADLPLRRGPSAEAILANARGDANDIARFFPDKLDALNEIVKVLEANAALFEPTPQATLHGSFKLAQLLCRGTQLALIDFDSIAVGDPLYDVAEFVASLAYLRVSDEIPAAPLNESIERYLASYQQQVAWPVERRRLAWYVAIFLLGKIHSSLKRLEEKSVANIAGAFDLAQNWINVMVVSKVL